MSRSLNLKIAGVLFALLAASHVNGQCLAGCAGGPTCDCTAAASHTHSTSCNCPGCDAFLDQSGAWPSADDSAVPAYESITDDAVAPDALELGVNGLGSNDMIGSSIAPDIQQSASAPLTRSAGLASSLGAGAGSAGVPGMIGDFFGGGFRIVGFGSGIGNNPPNPVTVATAGGDRQFKTAENNSPFPRDRIFFNYNHFHNAVVDVNGIDSNLDRFTFGIEKTFGGGLYSFETRVPFASTVRSEVVAGTDEPLGTEFGNVALAVKRLLYQDRYSAASMGLGIVLPTGNDFEGSDVQGIDIFFENASVHLQPFFGYYYAPNRRAFHQFFLQFDFDAGDSEVRSLGLVDGLNQQSLMMWDYSYGYWLVRNRCDKVVRALAPMIELHYTTTITDQEYGVFTGQPVFLNDPRRDVLNLTGGVFMQLGNMASLKLAGIAPLRDGDDKLFDAEFLLQFVRNF